MSLPGFTELLVIFGIILVMFGGSRLPKLGGAIGESIRNFRKGIKDSETPSVDKNKELTDSSSKKQLNTSNEHSS